MTLYIRITIWASAVFLLSACGGGPRKTATPAADKAPPIESIETKPIPPRFEATDTIVIKTSLGSMTFELYGKQAPNTVENFLKYVDSGHFNGKIFHRVIDGFMAQGGGFDDTLKRGDTEAPIRLELIPGLKHRLGVISMARQPSDIHSATSQFFICVGDAPQLNGAYAAFGKLISGEETLFAISKVATHSVETDYGKMNDVPIQPVYIESITRL